MNAQPASVPEVPKLTMVPPTQSKPEPMTDAELDQAVAFGTSPDLLANILDAYKAMSIVGEEEKLLLYYLASCSRFLENPLCIMSISSSGAGKSALQSATLDLAPKEDVVRVSSMSPKCLFYQNRNAIRHKVLAFEELAGVNSEPLMYAMRTLMSEGVLRYQTTENMMGVTIARERVVEGPTSVLATTTSFKPNPETLSRMFTVGIDETTEATRRIVEQQRQAVTLEGIVRHEQGKRVMALSRNFQRLLEPVRVVIPSEITARMVYDDERLEARRAHKRFISLVQAAANIHQLTKPMRHFSADGLDFDYIEADEADVALAVSIFSSLYGQTLSDLKAPSRELLFLLRDMVTRCARNMAERSQFTWTRREVLEFAPQWSSTRLHTYLAELIQQELVAKVSGKKNSLEHYRLLWDGEGQDGQRFVVGLRS